MSLDALTFPDQFYLDCQRLFAGPYGNLLALFVVLSIAAVLTLFGWCVQRVVLTLVAVVRPNPNTSSVAKGKIASIRKDVNGFHARESSTSPPPSRFRRDGVPARRDGAGGVSHIREAELQSLSGFYVNFPDAFKTRGHTVVPLDDYRRRA